MEYTTDSVYYAQALSLRERELRLPLGLSLSVSDTQRDAEQRHWCLLDGSHLLASVSVVIESNRQWRLRQMAVHSSHQRKGLGGLLLACVEKHAIKHGVAEIAVHAREYAADFYRKLGYQIVGESFIEITLPHLKMKKNISSG